MQISNSCFHCDDSLARNEFNSELLRIQAILPCFVPDTNAYDSYVETDQPVSESAQGFADMPLCSTALILLDNRSPRRCAGDAESENR